MLNKTFNKSNPLKPNATMRYRRLKVYADFARGYSRRFLAERQVEARTPIAHAPHTPQTHLWRDDELTVAWLGHATVLMNFYGTWILTDPALLARVGMRVGANFGGVTLGPRRLIAPALKVRELPKIDVLLLSHAHMDHTDLPTLARLPRDTHAVVSKGNRDLVHRFHKTDELAWGDAITIKDVRVEALEVKHWGARKLTDTQRGYGGFLIEKNNRRIVFGGDTAYTSAFKRLRERGKQIDLSVMPIGAYDPYIAVHASPEQAWQMTNEMGARYILPIHHQTFRLSREPAGEPVERLLAAAGRESWRVAVTQIGATWKLPED